MDASGFTSEASQWFASSLVTPGVNSYRCGSQYVLGGYNVLGSTSESPCGHNGCYGTHGQYFERHYTHIKPHNMIYFSFTFNEIDTWDEDDTFQVVFDSVPVTLEWSLFWKNWSVQQDTCGRLNYSDQLGIRIFGRVAHSGSSLEFKFVMQNDEDSINESAGFRDVRLIFATVSDLTSSTFSEMCGIPTAASYLTQVCSCQEGFYADQSGNCQPCDSLCSSCFGPLDNQCYWYKDSYSGFQEDQQTDSREDEQQYFQFLAPTRSIHYARYLATGHFKK